MAKLSIFSNGAGVQSTAIAVMMMRGELPLPDIALFADPGWEHAHTLRTLRWIEKRLSSRGVRIVRCTSGDLRDDMERDRRGCSMPVYAIIDGNHKKTKLRRLCTRLYKLRPINQAVRGILGLRKYQPAPIAAINQIVGFSTDERIRAERMMPIRWRTCSYPLLDANMSREDCQEYLKRYGPPWEVHHSGCVGCPFKSDAGWRWLQKRYPDEWRDACEFDDRLRTAGLAKGNGKCYLHRSCKPLAEGIHADR